jgi:hypothetical protein
MKNDFSGESCTAGATMSRLPLKDDHGQDRPQRDVGPSLVNQVPQVDGNGNFQPDRNHGLGIHGEDHGDHQAENGNHDPQLEKNDEEEKELGAAVDILGGVIGDRFALIAHGDNQCPEIVHGPHDDAADKHPDHGRHPSPDHGQRRSDDGTGACDRCEVVTKDNLFSSRQSQVKLPCPASPANPRNSAYPGMTIVGKHQ